MEDFLKKTGWSSLITSFVTAIIGIIIILNPLVTMKAIAYVLGGAFIIFGIVKLVSYFVNKGTYDFYNYEMIFGAMAIVIGIITIAFSGTIGTIFRIVIGIWILYSGFLRLGLVTKLKTLGLNEWKYALIIAIAILICGVYVLVKAETIGIAIGVAIIIYSVMDIIEGIIFLKNVDAIF